MNEYLKGNLVMYNGVIRVVHSTDNVHAVYLKRKNGRIERANLSQCKPVGINADTCEMIGMKLDDQDCYSVWIDNLLYSFYLPDHEFCFGQGMNFSETVRIYEMHRLQNIIYFLTNKMLTYEQ